jgi:hypothetical protein
MLPDMIVVECVVMKTWLIILISSLIGAGIGVGITVAEFAPAEEVFKITESETSVDPATLNGGRPIAVVEGSADYDFGVMERNVPERHEFILKTPARRR